jgi:hypothetical protein
VDKFIEYCCRYGWPESVRTDNGTQFTSKLWSEICEKIGIRGRKTVVYRPKVNPTERHNRTIKQCIKSYVDTHKEWDRHLSAIAFAIRTSPSDTTGFTPAALTFGRELPQPTDVSENSDMTADNIVNCSQEEYVNALKERLSVALKTARENCDNAHKQQLMLYKKGRLPNPFNVGDIVLRETHILSDADKSICHSLTPKFEGPFKLTQQIGENTYVLEDMDGNIEGRRNSD